MSLPHHHSTLSSIYSMFCRSLDAVHLAVIASCANSQSPGLMFLPVTFYTLQLKKCLVASLSLCLCVVSGRCETVQNISAKPRSLRTGAGAACSSQQCFCKLASIYTFRLEGLDSDTDWPWNCITSDEGKSS